MLGKSFTSVASLAGNRKGLERDVGHVATYRIQMCKAYSVRKKGKDQQAKQKFDPSHQRSHDISAMRTRYPKKATMKHRMFREKNLIP